jgi:hypothetical protein
MLSEAVIVTFGAYREMIPASLFRCSSDNKKWKCDFNGGAGGITNVRIVIAEAELEFRVEAKGLDLAGIELNKPASFSLQIGDYDGSGDLNSP